MSRSPVLNTRRLLVAALFAALFVASAAQPAAAQSRAEVAAASQELGSDPDLAAWDIALTTDLLGPVFGSYGVRIEVAPTRWLSLAASPAWQTTDTASGLALVLSAHLWPMARGLDGLFVGPNVSAARLEGNGAAQIFLGAGAEAGWQIVWGGLAVAVSGEIGWATQTDGAASGLTLGARVALGWAWR